MSPITIGVLAVSMSVDAFIASLGRGAAARRPGFGQALKTGLVFGLVETLTPLIGWAAGNAASAYVEAWDHWLAFGLLAIVGLRMALLALRREADEPAPASTSRWALLGTAFGTSIDAMAVGASLAFLDVNIFVVAVAIGVATMVMSTTGMLAGRLLGHRFGRAAEFLGGLALVALGALILHEHLTAG